MADAFTPNHNFVLPEVGASKDSWGTKWNTNLTQLDALLKVGLGSFVARAGDTMTGQLTLPVANPTAGAHAAHKSYVDTQIDAKIAALGAVPRTRNLIAGSGIAPIGDLTQDRTIAVDGTVLRTSGNQIVGGIKTFEAGAVVGSGNLVVKGDAAGTKRLLFRDSDETDKAVIYVPPNSANLNLAAYSGGTTHGARLEISAGGSITAAAGSFAGSGAGLTNLPAASLTGTISAGRMSGNYSWANLDLSGRLKVAAGLAWEAPSVLIEGGVPNIHFRQTDGASAMVGTNTGAFYILGDADSNGTFENTALQVNLNSEGVFHLGTKLAYQNHPVNAGNGLTGGGQIGAGPTLTLGTPGAITATSTNSVSSTSHTHALGESAVRALIAEGIRGQIGTYVLATKKTTGDVDQATAVPGSALAPSADGQDEGTGSLGGSWRSMGYGKSGAGTLWLRIS